jgi:hypothetical protein
LAAARRRCIAHRLLPALIGWCLGAHCVHDSDAFWHLMLGRAALRARSRIVPEPTALAVWSEPCHVKEWLWDVVTYGVQQLGGFTLLSVLPSVFGALLGYRLARLVEQSAGARLQPIHSVLATLPLCAVAEALDVRPNLAFFCLLVWLLQLSVRFASAEGRERTKLGVGLVLLCFFWVQVHASCVLAPLLFVLALLDARFAGRRDPALRSRLRGDGLVFIGMLLALTTGAHGFQVAQLVLTHAGGDAARHITDMRRFDWERFAPLSWHVPAIALALTGLGLLGMLVSGELSASGLALAAFGGAMTFSAARFVFVWGLLLVPWAASGVAALARSQDSRPLQRLQWASVVLAIPLVAWTAMRVDAAYGPLFRYGLREGDHPEAAARLLEQLPQGTRVFTEYTLGAPLGFWLDGHARTFVDSRTMLYFDDTDFALSRDMSVSASALSRGIERFGLNAAVVERDSSACMGLAARWIPVVIEARHTTFLSPELAEQSATSDGLPGLAPCGPLYFAPSACDVGGAELARSLSRLRSLRGSAFLQLMTAAATLQCQGRPVALTSLPSQAESRHFRSPYRLYHAWTLLLAGQIPQSLAAIEASLDAHDPLAARVLLEPAAGVLQLTDARRLLERAVQQMDDSAPPALRARLALVCMGQGDTECARYQGLRALAFGDESARPALLWAADHHASARVRADLRAWLDRASTEAPRAAAPAGD